MLMVSSIQYCEFSFLSLHVADDELRAINNRCCSGRNYVDHSASTKFNGNIGRKNFQHEDILKYFVREFEYDAKKDGYWSDKNLIIQSEDFIDLMKGICGNKFILKFMVDHYCVHDRQRED